MARPNCDADYLARLRDCYAANRLMPTFAQIRDLLGFASKAAVTRLVSRLCVMGYVEQTEAGRLKPGKRFFEVPLADEKVRAGLGEVLVPEAASDVATIAGLIDARPSSSVMLKVKGNSMRDVGVLEGDYAFVEQGVKSHPGDIVLALVDGNFTIKELRHRAGKPVLVAHNRGEPVIEPVEGLEILGVVRGVVRSYPSQRNRQRGAGQ
ncbi:MAG: S24 family peptidase [Ramlibacter sp.]|nr:S24 family peptidase [Ramlibacter sp.]